MTLFVFGGQAFAYDGGLLNGQPGQLYLPRDATLNGTYTDAVTDNDTSTQVFLPYLSNNSISWTLSATANITSYRIQRSGSGGATVTFYNAAGTSIHAVSRATGTFNVNLVGVKKVSIINGSSGSSTYIQEFDIFGEFVYPVPSALVATPDTRSVKLAWNDIPDAGHLGYVVYMDNQLITATPITNKNYIVTGLAPDVPHKFYVKSVYTGGFYSQMSNEVTAAAYGDPINKPQLSGTEFLDRIDLQWTAVIGAQSYRLYAVDVGQLYAGTNLTYSHTGLPLGTAYTYYVVAYDEYGRTVTSDQIQLKTREPPDPVYPIIEVLSKTHDTVQLRFKNGSPPYTLYRDDDLISNNLSTNVFTFNGTLTSETLYHFRVGYTDVYGRYLESQLDVTTGTLPDAVMPVLTANNVTAESLRLTWNQVGVSYKVLQNGVELGEQTTTFRAVYGLTEKTAYTYQVIAIDRFGRENASNVLTVTTSARPVPTDPPAPTGTPPPISHSDNPDLNKANDQLIQGAKDTKESSMVMIWVIIGIFILIFGAWWLIRIFKKKMTAVHQTKSSGASASAGSAGSGGSAPMNLSLKSVRKTNYNAQKGHGRNNYYVEKTRYSSRQGKQRY
ncbi:hypothetical protein SAMN04487969_15515 [Paenibacillus algorifonticola]|uniref:Fibronectin type-III domain-containing protein n=1 Tax=Paenibacillus algorifonticola TaxID=684063 RepID=A0A1I2J4V6_9BACL|nr:hypothetical protein SAMN04487969_15515 [Paenibacillus algorifonticola]